MEHFKSSNKRVFSKGWKIGSGDVDFVDINYLVTNESAERWAARCIAQPGSSVKRGR
jgi:hypothetical protein